MINRLPAHQQESGFINKLELWKHCQRSMQPVSLSQGYDDFIPQLSVNRHPSTIPQLEPFFRELQRCGISSVALWRLQLLDNGLPDLITLLDRYQLRVSSLSMSGAYSGSHGHSYEAAVRDTRGMVKYAAKLQAQSVIVRTGAQNNHLDKHMQRLFQRGVMDVVDLAGQLEVNLSIQPTHPKSAKDWSPINSLQNMANLVKKINSKHVGLSFSNFHLSEEPQLLDRLSKLTPFINHVQLSSLPHVCRCPVKWCFQSRKQMPIAEIVRLLHDNAYRGPYEIMLSQATRLLSMKPNDDYRGCVDCFNKFWTDVL